MRRALAAAALVLTVSTAWLAPAAAHGDYSGGWTDPAPGTVLDGLRGIAGSVSHVHGIEVVNLNLVVPADGEAPEECAAEGGPWRPIAGGGQEQVSFTFDVVFPCNIAYQVQGSAQAGAGEGTRFDPDPAPGPFDMTTVVNVAIPAEPVDGLVVRLQGPPEAADVRLDWSPGAEPDIQRYVVTRDGEVIGEIGPDDEMAFLDTAPPAGERATYEVVAVRSGPNGDVDGRPASASIDVPEKPAADDADDSDTDDGEGDGGDDPGTTSGGSDGGGSGGVRLPAPTSRPSRTPAPSGPPTTLDTGFQERLPFGEAPADEVAAPPAGDGSVVASFDDADEPPLLNQETWTFIAGGLALLMGSMVIRHVTRRAAAGY